MDLKHKMQFVECGVLSIPFLNVFVLLLCVKVIEKYLQSTHAPTHSDYTMSVLDIFKVDREGESNNFLSNLDNR